MSFTLQSKPRMLALLAAVGALALHGCQSESADRAAAAPEAGAKTSAPAVPEPVTSSPAAKEPPSAAPGVGNLPSTRESVAATPGDIALVGKVESALAAETALHGSSIAVQAADGVVTLLGSTKDPELRSMAAQVALSIDGVRSVKNELTISADV